MRFDPTLPHPLPEVSPELFDELLSESQRFVDSLDCRVLSDELPTRFLDFWLMPVGETDAQCDHYQALYESDECGVLLQLPLYLFDHVYHRRYDPPTNDALGAGDAAEVFQRLESDPEYQADIRMFARRLRQFQMLLRYIRVMYELGLAQSIYRFDLFDIDAYDEVITEIMGTGMELFIGVLNRVDDLEL